MPEPQPKTVTVVGGGLAGIAAACALADSGYRVHLLERRPYLGGRASSYEHPGTGEVIDNCQHVLIGRCTSLIDLYRRLGVLDAIRWYDRFTFLTPGGQPSIIQPGSLPAPFHSTLAFLRAPAFSSETSSPSRAASRLHTAAFRPTLPKTSLHWLHRHGQTPARHRLASGNPSSSPPSTKTSTASRSTTPPKSFASPSCSRPSPAAWAFPPSP